MPLDMVKNICTDFLNTEFPLPHSTIILSGGDPLLHPNFSDICRIVRELNGRVVLSTNGILIPTVIDEFQRSDSVQVSIDGDASTNDSIRGAGSYNCAVQALQLLQERHIPHSISFTVNQENQHCIEHVINLCSETGSYLFNFNFFQPVQNKNLDPIPYSQWIKHRQDVSRKLKKLHILMPDTCLKTGCIAGILGISILPDGTIWDCSRHQQILGKFPQKIRDVLFWNEIRDKTSRDQFQTCCRRSSHE
jgi:MoaA/NifB/PqqE/SkfB family radical SAM enzyme